MRKISFLICLVLCGSLLCFFGGCAKDKGITTYQIDCILIDNELTATETVNFFNHSENALSIVKFNLYPNAFRKDAKFSPISEGDRYKAYENGLSYGDIEILSAKNKDKPLEFSIDGQDQNILTVYLKDEIFPNESISITLEFKVALANVIARTGVNSKTINLANFYPIVCALDEGSFYECVYYSSGDPFYSDVADYKVKIACDSDFIVASSGKLIEKTERDNTSIFSYEINNARSFAMVLSKDFNVMTENYLGTEINYYYYDDNQPENSLKVAKQSLEYFTNTFGEFKYSTYSVVQTKFIQGGMEFPALVYISDDLEESAYREVIVHETAHQWWQTAVGNNEIEHAFLDEGLSEYSVVLFYENHPEYSLTRKDLISASEKTYKVFCTVADKVYGKVNTIMNRPLNEFISEYEYVILSYVKPCIMMDYLRETIGEKAFFNGLKVYYKNYCFKNANPYDLVGVYEKLGADTNGFFEAFFEGKVII